MQLTGKRTCVTGGAGFIGSHLVDHLVAAGNEVLIVDDLSTGTWENIAHHAGNTQVRVEQADVRDLPRMADLLQNIDVVFHLAVVCARLSLQAPLRVHEVNATGTLTTCQACLGKSIERLVYVSSAAVYGDVVYSPLDEKHPVKPTNMYGASKAAGEHYAHTHRQSYGLPVTTVRLFNTYGPREHSRGASAEVIPRFVLRALAGAPPVIFSTGEQTCDFTWVQDTVHGLVLAAECDELVGDCVNIARSQDVSIVDLCHMVLQLVGREDIQPSFVPAYGPANPKRNRGDIRKAQEMLGFDPKTSLEEGLTRYIAWVRGQNIDLEHWIKQEQIRNW